MCAYFTKELI
jgi:hypothetical protein